MKKSHGNPAENSPTVSIVTDKNDLAAVLANDFIKNLCYVEIITENDSYWREKLKITKEARRPNVVRPKELDKKKEPDYVVFLNLYQDKKKKDGVRKNKTKKRLKLAIELAKKKPAKSIFIFPFVQTSTSKREIITLKNIIFKEKGLTASVLYVGQLLGPNMNLSKDDNIARLLYNASFMRSVTIPKRKVFLYPVSIENVSKEMVKTLFSFGFYGKETAIVSSGVTPAEFFHMIRKQWPNISLVEKREAWEILTDTEIAKIILRQDIEKEIQDTADYIKKMRRKKVRLQKVTIDYKKPKGIAAKILLLIRKIKRYKNKAPLPRVRNLRYLRSLNKTKRAPRNWILNIALIIFLLIMFPTLAIIVSTTSLLIARKQAEKGSLVVAEGTFRLSYAISSAADAYLSITPKLLRKNALLSPPQKATGILVRTSNLGIRAISLANSYSEFSEKIFSESTYDLSQYAKRTSVEFDYLYKQASFLQGEADSLEGAGKTFFNNAASKAAFIGLRKEMLLGKRIAEELPNLLGLDKQKTYLLIFQNNLQIRPTGGVIESFALLTFSDGGLINIEVLSANTADAQLKGFVEPPGPINKHLSKKSWYLRDSNWDADFVTTAAQVEWFLDKEIDRSVDGVVAIDLSFIKAILEEAGSIELKSVESEITKDNIYEIAQTQKGDIFSVELLSAVIEKIIKPENGERIRIIRSILKSLEERHVQIFLHNLEIQRSLAEVSWDGALPAGDCLVNCMADWFGVVEANLGENNINNYISRKKEVNIIFEEGLVKRNLVFLLENLAKEGEYKSYIRVLAPQDSGFSPVVVKTKEGQLELVPEIIEIRGHKEAGIYLEVMPKESILLFFSWESPLGLNFEEAGEYEILVRKQAGIKNFPAKIKIHFPKALERWQTEGSVLTKQEVLEYNTELSRDFVSRIYWR